MGLDLYAGPLVRYYTGAWETEAQQAGRVAGFPVQVVYSGGGPRRLWKLTAPWRISAWLRRIRSKYAKVIRQDLSWQEGRSSAYFARKPDHDGRWSLVLAGAYAEHPQFAMPEQLPDDIEADPAYAAIGENYLSSVISVLECHMYLPSAENFILSEPDPVGNKRFITSTANLGWALDVVNDAHWRADSGHIEEWAREPPARGKTVLRVGDGKHELVEEEEPITESLQGLAKFGFAIYSKALAFSREHNVPILTDE
jgi:hypothetical protein